MSDNVVSDNAVSGIGVNYTAANNLRLVLKYLFFSAFIGIFGGGIYVVVGYGYPKLLLLPLLILAVLVSLAAERVIPYSQEANTSHGDFGTDTVHALVNGVESVVLVTSAPILGHWFKTGLWPEHWPFAAQLLLAIVLFDFGVWLAHFASHKITALWRFHAVHHSPTRLYSFNGLMKHPVHLLIEQVPGAIIFLVMGIPIDASVALMACVVIQLLLQHSNVDYRVPVLEYFFCTNSVHRFHHVNDAVLGNCNYGLFTNVWDIVFGTFRFNRERNFTTGDIGLEDSAKYPRDYLGHLVVPFRQP